MPSVHLSAIQNPQSAISSAAGSPLWQVVFISFGVILILFEVLRGWRLGLMRQIMRLIAIGAAYGAAFLGSVWLVPAMRPFFKMPDQILSILCGAILAVAAYMLVSGAGAILFKRTSQQESGLLYLIYGFAGSILGLFFGFFLLWLTVASVRTVGALAEGQAGGRSGVAAHSAQDPTSRALDVRRRFFSDSEDGMQTLTTSLARLKNSLELGSLGSVLKNTDLISQRTYEMLEKAGSVLSNPERTQKFLTFPGARELAEHPKIVALRSDPENWAVASRMPIRRPTILTPCPCRTLRSSVVRSGAPTSCGDGTVRARWGSSASSIRWSSTPVACIHHWISRPR